MGLGCVYMYGLGCECMGLGVYPCMGLGCACMGLVDGFRV